MRRRSPRSILGRVASVPHGAGPPRTGIAVTISGLRPEIEALVSLIGKGAGKSLLAKPEPHGMLEAIGRKTWKDALSVLDFVAFAGESFAILLRSIAQPRRIRWRAVLHNVQTAGFDALPITGLLSFLMGIVIAYQGAISFSASGRTSSSQTWSVLRCFVSSPLCSPRSSSLDAQVRVHGPDRHHEGHGRDRRTAHRRHRPQELLVLPKFLALTIVLPLPDRVHRRCRRARRHDHGANAARHRFRSVLDRLDEAIVMSTYLTGL